MDAKRPDISLQAQTKGDKMRSSSRFFTAISLVLSCTAPQAAPSMGPAPKGDATSVANRIIKQNFDDCKSVTRASRANDGTIRATCNSKTYLVFTLSDPKTNKLHEVAMNCTAAKQLLKVNC
jgi:hypothetical protein